MKEILIDLAPILPILLVVLFISKKQKSWSELTEKEKRRMRILIGILVFLLLMGVIVNLLFWSFLKK